MKWISNLLKKNLFKLIDLCLLHSEFFYQQCILLNQVLWSPIKMIEIFSFNLLITSIVTVDFSSSKNFLHF